MPTRPRLAFFIVSILLMTLATSVSAAEVRMADRNYSRSAEALFIVDKNGVHWEVAPGLILVRFAASSSQAQTDAVIASNGLVRSPAPMRASGYVLLEFEVQRDPMEVLADLLRDPSVLDACPDTKIKSFGANDTYYPNQWTLRKMRADRAWKVTTGTPQIKVAIIDRGIDYLHEDLIGAMWVNPGDADGDSQDSDADSLWYGQPIADDSTGWDFIDEDNRPLPARAMDAHGTPVAGVAFATRNNSIGVVGVLGAEGADGPRMISLRAEYAAAHVSRAIEYAWRKGADVINMSFGVLDDYSNDVASQIDSATAHGVIIVAAAGNTGSFAYPISRIVFPASHPHVIAVGATDSNDVRLNYSCKGPELDLVASGNRDTPSPPPVHPLWTTDNYQTPGDYNPTDCACPPENPKYVSKFVGTSAASPAVAALAALVKSHFQTLSAGQVRQRLVESAKDLGNVGPDSLYGYGRIDAYRALTEWGTVTGNVTWGPSDTHNGVRYVSGDLTIAPGATLTIMPGTIIRVANDDDLRSGADTLRVEINVEGELIAEGTSSDPIVFESWHPATSEDWVGFYFDSQSDGGTFDHCVIKGAEYAIESYVPVTVTSTAVDTCGFAALVSQAGGAFVKDCTFTDPGTYGIFLATDSSVVRNTTVDNAAGTALHVQPNAAVTVRGSSFLNSDKGLYHSGSTTFVDVDSSCVFSGNAIGVHFHQTAWSANVRNSTINSNTSTGVACDESHPIIRWNTLRYNSTAINCGNEAEPSIRENVIKNNTNGIIVAFDADPDIGIYPTTGGNVIAYSSSYHVRNYTGNVIAAQNNCWNMQLDDSTNCEPKAAKISGSVDTDHANCCDIGGSLTVQIPPTPGPGERVATGLTSIIPNPFNPQTTIHYGLSAPSTVEIRVYDVAGRLVRELANASMAAGSYFAVWDGTDRRGTPAASGIYFVRMVAGRESFTRKMVLLK